MPRMRMDRERLERTLDSQIEALPDRCSQADVLSQLSLHEQIATYEKSRIEGCRVSKRTVLTHYAVAERWAHWAEEHAPGNMSAVDRDAIQRYILHLESRGLKPETVRENLRNIRELFAYLTDQGCPIANPLERIEYRVPADDPVFQALTIEEMRSLIEAALENCRQKQDAWRFDITFKAVRDLLITVMLVGNGLRPCEMAEIRLSDIQRKQGFIHIRGKGNERYVRRYRKVYLDAPLLTTCLDAYLSMRRFHKVDRLFCSWDGFALRPTNCSIIVHLLGNQLGLTQAVTPRLIRKSFCTHVSEQGADPFSVAELMGHFTYETALKHYTYFSQEQLHLQARGYNPLAMLSGADHPSGEEGARYDG